ncbi:tail tape measure protein [Agrobacterium phage OLIVR2]|uniref:Tail tape measure protein n=1 Tax=Agrobacterium phage OLIVR1 TaxID=2723769 RepID=A0A858MRV9_9CAUD|nr:hypothetical protein [Xanthomonas campestris]YP_010107127.1 tail length tape measure protein [Agrobacterium phage OLIVR1]QIW87395.1 tail tape measure protein [Agrobacterium phage OLIVR2]QIW87502.1 tail tape measure protein [Agrobacterium phage OLIVR3]MCF8861593.1 hypothetical protein [Xanthomonas campestris pv. campestris]QIW87288.1 tail tape measure protein [Agrobacterium phage OLIVR1]
MTGKNYLEMSDEEFLALPERNNGVAEEVAPSDVPSVETQEDTPVPVIEETPAVVEPPVEEQVEKQPDVPEVTKPEDVVPPVTEPELDADGKPIVPPAEPENKGPDLQAFYERIIAPIKANGKTIEIKDADDAIRLMQMGAGFGRKMQDIQPHLKTLRFLEQNNLLNVDQADLAFLVDLRNKNPDAIKKLVKEAGIDPLDFNNEEEVNYRTSIPEVTDQQVVFREALDNLKSQEGGLDSLTVMNTTWDAKSHEVLMNNPSLLEVIHEQRQLGIYDRIVSEMDRQKALGKIPHTTPFIEAYKQVGDHLRDNNGFADLVKVPERQAEKQVAPATQPQLIETRVAAPKSSVTNNDKAKAAAAPKTTPRKTAPIINPLAMSDEEFTKQYGNRF